LILTCHFDGHTAAQWLISTTLHQRLTDIDCCSQLLLTIIRDQKASNSAEKKHDGQHIGGDDPFWSLPAASLSVFVLRQVTDHTYGMG
jgi:hypothetical protein